MVSRVAAQNFLVLCFILSLFGSIECLKRKKSERAGLPTVFEVPADTAQIRDSQGDVVMFLSHSRATFTEKGTLKCDWTLDRSCVMASRCEYQLGLSVPTVLTAVMKQESEFEGHKLQRWNLFETVMASADIDVSSRVKICSTDGSSENAMWEEFAIQETKLRDTRWASKTRSSEKSDAAVTEPFIEQFQTKVVQEYEKHVQKNQKINIGASEIHKTALEEISQKTRRERSRDRSQIEL